jgi:hypothetical protein
MDDGGRENQLAKPGEGLLGPARDDNLGADFFQRNLQIERKQRLVLDDEDDVPAQVPAPSIHGRRLARAYDTDLKDRQLHE